MMKLIKYSFIALFLLLIATCVNEVISSGAYAYQSAEASPLHSEIPENSSDIVVMRTAPFDPMGGYSFRCSVDDFTAWSEKVVRNYPDRSFSHSVGKGLTFYPSVHSNRMEKIQLAHCITISSLVEDRSVSLTYDLDTGTAYFYYTTR